MRARIFYIDNLLLGYNPKFEPRPELYRYVATIDIDTPEQAFKLLNRGSGEELTDLMEEEKLRSMSVGDIVYVGDIYYVCEFMGWRPLNVGTPERQALATELYKKAVAGEDARATSSVARNDGGTSEDWGVPRRG